MTKYGRFLKVVYISCGLVGFISYFAYLLKLLFWSEGIVYFAVALSGCLISGVPVFCRKFFEKRLCRRIFGVFENVFAWGMAFYSVTFIVLSVCILTAGSIHPDAEALPDDSAFVVFGARIRGTNPGAVLERRLETASEYLLAMPESICVVSGGQGEDEVCPEAEVMRDYLTNRGIAEERILTETESENSAENIVLSVQKLKDRGYGDRPTVMLSSAFHIPRIKLMCDRIGVKSEFLSSPNPRWYIIYPTLVREYMSYVKIFIFGV